MLKVALAPTCDVLDCLALAVIADIIQWDRCKSEYTLAENRASTVSCHLCAPSHLLSMGHAMWQVQDVGLIFLSAMASSIALLCEEDGYEPRQALGTSLLTLAIATFIVGILIVLVGAQMLPVGSACASCSWRHTIAGPSAGITSRLARRRALGDC